MLVWIEPLQNGGLLATDSHAIRDYLRIIYRRRWLIVGIMVAGLLAGLVRNWTAIRIFEASATLQIGADPNVLGLDRPLVDQRDWMREFLPTQLAVLESRELASMARQELMLRPCGTDRRRQMPTVDEIVDGRSVSPVSNTRLVSIGFRSTDPVLAAQVANATRSRIREVEHRIQVDHNRRGVRLVEATGGGTAQARSCERSGAAVVQEGSRCRGPRRTTKHRRPEAGGGAVGGDKSQGGDNRETDAVRSSFRRCKSNHDALDTLPAIASNPYIHGIKDELAGLQQQLAQASEQLGDRHPDIIKLRDAVDAADRKLRTEISKLSAAIGNEYAAARARESALTVAFERQKVEVQQLNAKAVEYTALDRAATANRLLLDNLEQRSEADHARAQPPERERELAGSGRSPGCAGFAA